MGQLPFQLRAHEPVGNAAALQSGGVVHRLVGCAIENRTRRPVAQRLMQPLLVVEPQPVANALARLRNRAIRFDEHVLILQAAPKPLDKDIVQEPPLAIHADPDTTAFQLLQKPGTGELDALIGIENLGPTRPGGRFLQRFSAEIRLHGDRNPPSQNPPAEPVHHRDQIHEALGHRDVSYIGAPHLVRPLNTQAAQQIRINLVIRVPLAGVGLLVDRLQSHHPHQPAHALAVYHHAILAQRRHHPPRPVERPLRIKLVHPTHQRQVVRVHRRRLVIQRRAGDLQQLALRHDRKVRIVSVDQRATFAGPHGPDLFRKKSRSTVNWPIFSYKGASCVSAASPLFADALSRANSVAVPSSSVFFQAWIWLAWTPNLLDSSATVPYSRIAARATFALNSGLCFFRVFDKSHLRPTGRSQAGLSLSYLSSFRGPPQYLTGRSSGSTAQKTFTVTPRNHGGEMAIDLNGKTYKGRWLYVAGGGSVSLATVTATSGLDSMPPRKGTV